MAGSPHKSNKRKTKPGQGSPPLAAPAQNTSFNESVALYEAGRYAEALAFAEKGLVANPASAPLFNVAAASAYATGQFDLAEKYWRFTVDILPEYAGAHNNLGILFMKTGRFERAEETYRKAVALQPEYAEAYTNLGVLLREMERFEESEDAYRKAVAVKPEYAGAQWNLSLLLLTLGRFEEAWPLYDARFDPMNRERVFALPAVPFPRWQGEPISGKSLLLAAEQGFGDTLQFIRYASLLKAMGASRITLICRAPLIDLLRTAPGIDNVVPPEYPIPENFWSPLLSLPGLCGTTLANLPASLPYLSADPRRIEAWHPRLPNTGFRVGLVWKGKGTHTNDAKRSLPGLETLAPLWEVPGISFISLQKGAGEEEAASPPPGQALVHLGSEIQDFADTAAIVSQLDLVICVDTAVAHLAGALGKPCWVMLPYFGTDWRWLLERTDSPWYPGVMRLFRQGAEENWGNVAATVAGALREAVARGPETNRTPPRIASSQPPPPADVTTNEAVALYQAGRHAEALARAEEALSAGSESADACSNLGVIFKRLGRLEQAESAYRRAIKLNPTYSAAHYNFGNLLRETGRFDEAETAYQRAIALNPGYADAYNNLGKLFLETKRFDEAEAACRRAIALQPKYVEAYCNLGNLCQELKRFDEAEAAYRQAIALRPGYADAFGNLGALLKKLGRFDQAEMACRQAIALQPQFPEAYYSLGNLQKELQCFDEAEVNYRRALSQCPAYPEARFNLGLMLLTLGRFEEGWPLYEARYDPALREPVSVLPTLSFPRWQGASLSCKSLLLVAEQGFGDALQFIRYASLLKTMGTSRITLACRLPLIELLRTVPGVDSVVPRDGPIPVHNYWSLLLSLPGLCGTTLANLPASLPYLSADSRRIETWRPRLPTAGFRVGLVWKGNSAHKNDAARSLPGLETLVPLWEVSGVSFISLQKGAGEEEAASPPPGQALVHLGAEIQDFADTAAIVSQLDLVICVDTAVAHLAGALGKPCWVMLPYFGTDWRWLLERTDSPWYPGVMRLFRQGKEETWGDVAATVAGALREVVEAQGKR